MQKNKAKAVRTVIEKLQECGSLLEPFADDPQVRQFLPDLEGSDGGWFHGTAEDPEFLVDRLVVALSDGA